MTVRRSLAATGLAMALAGCAVSGTDGLTAQQKAQVKRVEVCLNDPTPVEGSFIQHGPQQNGGAGHFRYAPGSLGLDYTVPHAMTLRASGAHLVLDDSQTGAVTRLNLSRNPLGLLLHVPVRFDGKIRVTDIQTAPGASQISLAQADNPSQGLLTLRFLDKDNRLQLSSLDGVDARGNRILIQLSDISQGSNVTGQSASVGIAPKN
ncbi:outer membrane lipoprotein carrier protein LolA [Asaia bogorensis]|uniref:LolA family protein n=1 Tax=Asaia bogorensis TaxID=91915 RepID=UPI001F08C440|nr:outer membrane lipoprotein carrier protein LolA [Asaia bogorensis]